GLKWKRLSGGFHFRWRGAQELLVEHTDADQGEAEPDEGQCAPCAIQSGHVEQEHFCHRCQDENARGETQRARIEEQADQQEANAEDKPDRGVGVELGIVSDALVEARTVEYGADLEGNPGECKRSEERRVGKEWKSGRAARYAKRRKNGRDGR